MKERWKEVPGYKGRYEVSSSGKVRSLDRRIRFHSGMRLIRGKDLSPALIVGYPAVSLSKDNVNRKFYVHDLVLRAFVGPPPKGNCARHFPDATKTNCRISNLRWGTRAENIGDHLGKYLTDDDIRQMRKLGDEGVLQADIAKLFGCVQGYVSRVLSGHCRAST